MFFLEFMSPEFTRAYYEALPTRQSIVVSPWRDQPSALITEGGKRTRTITYLQAVPHFGQGDSVHATDKDQPWASVVEEQISRMTPEGSLILRSIATLTLGPTTGAEPRLHPAAESVYGVVTTQFSVSPSLQSTEQELAILQYDISVKYQGRIAYLANLIERHLLNEAISSLEAFLLRIKTRLYPGSRTNEAAFDDSDSAASDSNSDEQFFDLNGPAADTPGLVPSKQILQELSEVKSLVQSQYRSLHNRIAALERKPPPSPTADSSGDRALQTESLAKEGAALPASSSSAGLLLERIEQLSRQIDTIQSQSIRRAEQESQAQAELIERVDALETFRQFTFIVSGTLSVGLFLYFSPNLRALLLRPFSLLSQRLAPSVAATAAVAATEAA
jgi:hypothetical protein